MKRETIIEQLTAVLSALPTSRAVWLGGSFASGRLDAYSDIDMQCIVADEAVADTFTAVEEGLRALAPIAAQYDIPQPAWHGHHQSFYHLEGTPAWLLIDFLVMEHSNPNWFLEPERHGHSIVLLDRDNLVVPAPFDRERHLHQMHQRRQQLCARFHMFQGFVTKEFARGNVMAAVGAYHRLALAPLVELLLMKHTPDRYDFGWRYLDRDLPDPIHQQLQQLALCPDLATMRQGHEQVVALFKETEAFWD